MPAVHTRQWSHQNGLVLTAAAAIQPFNLCEWPAPYAESFVRSGNVWFRWAIAAGAFRHEVQVTSSGDCSHPRFAWTPRRRVILCYQRTAGIYERTSDDDGVTWSAETQTFAGGSYPDILVARAGQVFRTAIVAGTLTGILQEHELVTAGPPASLLDSLGAAITPAASSYRMGEGPRGEWWLHIDLGGGSTSLLVSDDAGATWGTDSSPFAGGSHPALTVLSGSGIVLLFARVAGNAQVRRLYARGLALEAAVPVTVAGVALALADDDFSAAGLYESSHRLRMACVENGASAISDLTSGDDGESFAR